MAPIIAVHIAAAMVLLPAFSPAQDFERAPHFPGQGAHEAQEILRKVEGLVTAIDTNALTMTIRLEGRAQTFKVTSRTKFTRGNNQIATLADIKAGQTVNAIIKMVRGQPEEIASANIKPE